MKKWVMTLATGIMIASPLMAAAQDAAAPGTLVRRLCKESDLAGNFSLVTVTETPPMEEVARFQSYPSQYIAFNPDHTFGTVFAQHPMAGIDEMKREMRVQSEDGLRTIERKYNFAEGGVLNLVVDGTIDYTDRCMVVTARSDKEIPGDIVLAGYTKNKTEFYKLYRRWP